MWLAGARRSRRIDAKWARHIVNSRIQAAAAATAMKTSELPPSAYYDTRHMETDDLEHGLQKKYFSRAGQDYLLLPTPLPKDRQSATNDLYFADSSTLDQISIIDACLHEGFNLQRAKTLFDKMREGTAADSVLDIRLYNNVLEGYVRKAVRDPTDRDVWLEEAWDLYDVVETRREKVQPTPLTYAIMLLAYHRFSSPTSGTPIPNVAKRHPADFVYLMRSRKFALSDIITNHVLADPDDRAGVIGLLSRAAMEIGDKELIEELDETESKTAAEDEIDTGPEIEPVKVYKPLKGDDGVPIQVGQVPFNLHNLRNSLQLMGKARRVLPDDAVARQKMLEESVFDVALYRIQHENEVFTSLKMAPSLKKASLRQWMWQWHQILCGRIEAAVAATVEAEKRTRATAGKPHIAPFLQLLRPEKLSILTIMETMRCHSHAGSETAVKITRALVHIGESVELEHAAQICKLRKVPIQSTASSPQTFSLSGQARILQTRLERQQPREQARADEAWAPEWSQITRVKVGAFLVDLLMDVAKITRSRIDPITGEEIMEDQTAFTHSYEYVRGHKLGVIKFNPILVKALQEGPVRDLVHPRHLPMLVKPKPWTDHDNGGYMFSKASVMRIKDSQEQLTYLRQASQVGNMELVFSGLDALGATPWQINRAVFDVVVEVWNSGQELGGVPPAQLNEADPDKPDAGDLEARAKYLKALADHNLRKANVHSERCSVNYKLEIAKAFSGETFYFPHNLDFRGRAYPIPPHMNHMGDDLSRSLLMFAESRPLGKQGLRWLKIHLSNMFGFDKASFDDRVAFTEAHLDDVFDSADNPLTGRKWWQKSEDPWQLLATCKELTAALRSPDPELFESFLPVHQDGTCNGLQHYAALGGDVVGAQQVNLDVTDRPADVYSFVAKMVDDEIDKDVAKGHVYAQMVQGKVSRKIVKQTVMTTVYGVTYIGARDQILRQVKDRRDLFAREHAFKIAAYLARKTLECIGDLFKGAKGIQTWLTTTSKLISQSIPPDRVDEAVTDDAAKRTGTKKVLIKNRLHRANSGRLAREQMTAVIWTTMLGLPVVQPYRKVKRRQILTGLQTVFISDPHEPSEVDTKKQSTAFPPNFIHSLDATHMMLTALECRAHNLTFASVHDSYWTHASTVDHMAIIIRDTFIALHGSNVLQRLQEEFKVRYAGHVVPVMVGRAPGYVDVSLRKMSELLGTEHMVPVPGDSHPLPEDIIDEDLDQEEEEDEEERPKKDGRLKESSTRSLSNPEFRKSKMVDLFALFPPLPTRGTFDVAKIRKSQYFFS